MRNFVKLSVALFVGVLFVLISCSSLTLAKHGKKEDPNEVDDPSVGKHRKKSHHKDESGESDPVPSGHKKSHTTTTTSPSSTKHPKHHKGHKKNHEQGSTSTTQAPNHESTSAKPDKDDERIAALLRDKMEEKDLIRKLDRQLDQWQTYMTSRQGRTLNFNSIEDILAKFIKFFQKFFPRLWEKITSGHQKNPLPPLVL